MTFFRKLKEFIQNIYRDDQIPILDKRIILVFLLLIISPLDLIPDWLPGIGLLDDLVYIGFILDYFFSVIDSRVFLSHFPWDMKAYARLKAIARAARFLVPGIVKKRLWSYKADPY